MPSFSNWMAQWLLLAGIGSCLGGCAAPAAKTSAAPSDEFAGLQHVSIVGGSSMLFFDKDTGKLWAYNDWEKPAQLVGQFKSFDKPLVVPSMAVTHDKLAAYKGGSTGLFTMSTEQIGSFDKDLAAKFNAMPRNLWPSENETELKCGMRSKWLESHSVAGAKGKFAGEILNVSTQGVKRDGGSETTQVVQVILKGTNASILGQQLLFYMDADFDTLTPADAMNWKNGQMLTISGTVGTASFDSTSPFGYESISIELHHATAELEKAAADAKEK